MGNFDEAVADHRMRAAALEMFVELKNVAVILDAVILPTANGTELLGPTPLEVHVASNRINALLAKIRGGL